jgi:hypothetical protein
MVRYLENILLIAGSVVLGGLMLSVAVGWLAALVLRPAPSSEPGLAWGAAWGAPLAGGLCGAPLGALMGLIAAIGWISRRGNDSWSVAAWTGIAAGLAVGAALAWAMHIELIGGAWHDPLEYWLTVALVLTVTATLGGFAGSMLPIPKRNRGRKRRRRP